MRFSGFLLLISGAVVVFAAVVLLADSVTQGAFLAAALAMQIAGIILVALSHRPAGSRPY